MNDDYRDLAAFYDDLAKDYHLLYADWDQSTRRQATVLRKLLQTLQCPPPCKLLDASCGIGTQAIGLARAGYQVTGIDLSPKAIDRAAREADRHGVELRLQQADFRALSDVLSDTFEIVLTYDNALPHLLTEEDLRQGLHELYGRLRPGGLFLASVRDYEALLQDKPTVTPVDLFGQEPNRYFSFQEWQWSADDKHYTFNHFIVQQRGKDWHTTQRTAHYRALRRQELQAALEQAGFRQIQWHEPAQTGYYQLIVTARRDVSV